MAGIGNNSILVVIHPFLIHETKNYILQDNLWSTKSESNCHVLWTKYTGSAVLHCSNIVLYTVVCSIVAGIFVLCAIHHY